jgi:hypothetical protein
LEFICQNVKVTGEAVAGQVATKQVEALTVVEKERRALELVALEGVD